MGETVVQLQDLRRKDLPAYLSAHPLPPKTCLRFWQDLCSPLRSEEILALIRSIPPDERAKVVGLDLDCKLVINELSVSSKEFLFLAGFLEVFPQLKALDLRRMHSQMDDGDMRNFIGLARKAALPELSSLRLHQNDFSSSEVSVLTRVFPNLTELTIIPLHSLDSLVSALITALASGTLAKLQTLSFPHTSLSSDSFCQLMYALPTTCTCFDSDATNKEPETELVHVSARALSYFAIHGRSVLNQVSLQLEIEVDESSRWEILADETIFCCGGLRGWDPHRSCYLLNKRGWVQRKADMSEERGEHGMLVLDFSVYVFGGQRKKRGCIFKEPLASCEKFGLVSNAWSRLPSMVEAKYNFNPCLFKGSVYLAGSQSSILEAFSPTTDTLLPFRLTLPRSYLGWCPYVQNEFLVVHTYDCILQFENRQGQLELLTETGSPPQYKHQNSKAVVLMSRRCFGIVQDGLCQFFNLETGEVLPEIS